MMRATGPGPVAVVHRILIATALASTMVYAVFEVRAFLATGEASAAACALVAFFAGIGIALYLRSLRGLAAKLTPRHRRD
jgi:hypothetical protein